MTTSRIAATLGGIAAVGAMALYVGGGGSGRAAAQQPTAPQPLPACVCAPATTLTLSGTSLIHCQCGPATCVVGEYVTGQAKNYSLQCVK
jgi:hypothetical protein